MWFVLHISRKGQNNECQEIKYVKKSKNVIKSIIDLKNDFEDSLTKFERNLLWKFLSRI